MCFRVRFYANHNAKGLERNQSKIYNNYPSTIILLILPIQTRTAKYPLRKVALVFK